MEKIFILFLLYPGLSFAKNDCVKFRDHLIKSAFSLGSIKAGYHKKIINHLDTDHPENKWFHGGCSQAHIDNGELAKRLSVICSNKCNSTAYYNSWTNGKSKIKQYKPNCESDCVRIRTLSPILAEAEKVLCVSTILQDQPDDTQMRQ